ncbi:MAG: hypothetical protein ACYDBB_05070 [Armatimonadota bacterium]
MDDLIEGVAGRLPNLMGVLCGEEVVVFFVLWEKLIRGNHIFDNSPVDPYHLLPTCRDQLYINYDAAVVRLGDEGWLTK